jgi:hypothetical protein
MKPKTILIIVLAITFAGLVAFALLREVEREEAKLATSITGIVDVTPELYASGQVDIVKTDRMALYLVDPATGETVALRIINPLVPPQTIDIGEENRRRGAPSLEGAYLLIGITDKDGEIFKVTPGEVYGRSPQPIALGTEQVRLMLSEPFRGSLFNKPPSAAPPAAAAPAGNAKPDASGMRSPGRVRTPMVPEGNAALSIRGEIRVRNDLKSMVDGKDRLVILAFDPEQDQPVASKIIPHAFLPQRFSIAVPAEGARKAYHLRVLTDKDGQPFNPVQGELIGRSKTPIPLGTSDLVFELDSPFQQ